MTGKITIALAGNPNSGKTSVFNHIAGAWQHVANYPGVTVEKKEGRRRHGDVEITVVDLPGTYSLTPYSTEERVARNFILQDKPDVVVDIIDASNLERNLYLAVQLIQMGAPLVLAFNMDDVAKARGIEFDLKELSRLLGSPIVPTVGHKGRGVDELLDVVVQRALGRIDLPPATISYGREINEELEKLERLINDHEKKLTQSYPARWLALKLLENDPEVVEKIVSKELLAAAAASITHLEGIFGEKLEIIIAERRYGFISGVCQETVKTKVEPPGAAPGKVELRHTRSDKVDAVLTNRIIGLPIFLVLMYLVFQVTFTVGQPLMEGIEFLQSGLAQTVSSLWPQGSESALKSLLVDGIIGGVGGVIVFLPNILLLFFAIAVLEDSGYMARAAFIMDRYMHRIGLHGKSFIPMLIGFGCTIPALMSTRTLENRRDRLTTMLVLPLISCGARFPIYMLLIPAFFAPRWRTPMLWIIYIIGLLLAMLGAKLLRTTILRGESMGLVLELPPYRLPTLRGLLIHMWERGWHYVKKAGTVILGVSILMWALTSYPKPPAERLRGLDEHQAARAKLEYSVTGRLGKTLEPALRPLGFDWKIGVGLVGAFAAKEVFVAQMGVVYAVGESEQNTEALREQLRRNYTPLVAFCIMLWCLVSTPCVATCAVMRAESNWKWALAQLAGLTALAYALTLVVHQVGSLLGIGT